MIQVFLFFHVLAAIMMGTYLMLPFLSARVSALNGDARSGFLHVLFATNRVGQLALVISLLSGGYVVGKGSYSVLWMVLAVVLFLALGAFSGVLGSSMRAALADASGQELTKRLPKIRTFSNLCGIVFFLAIVVMKFPNLFG